jgi:hypothetical protein
LKLVVKHSPEHFYELKLFEVGNSELYSDELESFFIGWKDRVPQRLFSFVTEYGRIKTKDKECMIEIINSYKNMGVVNKNSHIEVEEMKPQKKIEW